jgi:transcriptional regulator with XRE-family HTH domain
MLVAEPDTKSAGGTHGNNRLPTTTDRAVGRRIRSLRRAAGMTLSDLGGAVGVSGVQFQRYETGASRVTASRLLAICDALGVHVDTLIDEAVPDRAGHAPNARRRECLELARAFNAVADPTQRRAIIALARAFAGWQAQPAATAETGDAEAAATPEQEPPPPDTNEDKQT